MNPATVEKLFVIAVIVLEISYDLYKQKQASKSIKAAKIQLLNGDY